MSPIASPSPAKKRKKPVFAPLGWLSEKPETRSVQIAVIGTIIVHLLLMAVVQYLFKPEPVVHSTKRKPFSASINLVPPKPKPKVPVAQKSLPKFVETNPNAPTNKPDKTDNVSNRDQQSAQEKPSKINNTDRPAMEGKKDFKNDQIVDGRLSKPVENAPPEPMPSPAPTPPSMAVPKAQQNPLTGYDKKLAANATGFGAEMAKPNPNAKPVPKRIDGMPDVPVVDGPQVTTPQIDPHHPRARQTLNIRARPAILADNPFGTKNSGVTGRDARWSNYGDYMNKLEETVQIAWDDILSVQKSRPPPGTSVQITFILTSTGDIKTFVQVTPSPGMTDMGTHACEAALRNPAPFGKWTDDMIAVLGTEQQMTFTFFYE
jgi:hypothetical protein